jgi:hypothetical protein
VGEGAAELHQQGHAAALAGGGWIAHVGAQAGHAGQAGGEGDQRMPAEQEAEQGPGAQGAAEGEGAGEQAGVAQRAAAEDEGVDGHGQGLELRAQHGGLGGEAEQGQGLALADPVAGEQQGELGAALGLQGGQHEQQRPGISGGRQGC